MKPIDSFEDKVNKDCCPWLGKELTQSTLKVMYICRLNYEAGARGNEGCTVKDWQKCPLTAHQMIPSFRAAVAEGQRIAS